MGREYPIENISKYLKQTYGNYSKYLGHPKLEEAFCKLDKILNKKLGNYIFYGKREILSVVGAYLITIRGGVESPLECTLEQAIDRVMNNSEEYSGFGSCNHPLLFVYVNLMVSQKRLVATEAHMTQIFHNREREGNFTVILCEQEGVLPSFEKIPFVKTFNFFKKNGNSSTASIIKGMKD